jgi:RimK family alpha-L-glutamate ligase
VTDVTGSPGATAKTRPCRSGSLSLAIIGRATGWHARRLAASATARGHLVSIIEWASLASTIDGHGEALAPAGLAAADVVCVRGMPGGNAGQDRLEQVVFRMDVLGRLTARGTPVVNAPRSLEAAIDKYLASSRLVAAGLATPRTVVVQGGTAAAAAWEQLGGDCVVKPLFGSQGKGIVRLDTAGALTAWLTGAAGPGPETVCYLQEFMGQARWDARILLVGERAFAMRRTAPVGDWRTNLAVGGGAEPFSPPVEWLTAARRAAAALETEIAGVDLLPAADGGPLVLEVNAVPGWRGLEAVTGPVVTDAVADLLETRARG